MGLTTLPYWIICGDKWEAGSVLAGKSEECQMRAAALPNMILPFKAPISTTTTGSLRPVAHLLYTAVHHVSIIASSRRLLTRPLIAKQSKQAPTCSTLLFTTSMGMAKPTPELVPAVQSVQGRCVP